MVTKNGWDYDSGPLIQVKVTTGVKIEGYVGVVQMQDVYSFPQQKLLTKLLISGTLYVSESILTVAAVEQSKIWKVSFISK